VNSIELTECPAFLRANGYAIVPNVFASAELTAVQQQLSDQNLKRSRAGARHVLSCPAVSEMAHRAELCDIARAVLGPGALPFRATFFDKSPDSNWLVAWHQDTALPLTARRDSLGWGPWSLKDGIQYAHAPASALETILALRIHLDDSTGDNGPLRVLPDTHRGGVLTDEEMLQTAENSQGIECLVPTGGVVAMFPLLIHASSKSESQLPRRVLHIEYAAQLEVGPGLALAIV
jgi:ectoine hydroxylase-related dioxygenase (phytanoyl-CoA dioxygenase family)